MATVLSALDYLTKPEKYAIKPICVVFGDDLFLVSEVLKTIRLLVLPHEDSELSFSRFEGSAITFRAVLGEVSAMAMFGGLRLVQIDSADSFVSSYRDRLEQYAESPCSTGILLLQSQSFPSNTRLFQTVNKNGLIIDCKTISSAKIPAWLIARAKSKHSVEIEKNAAEHLVDLLGNDLGLLDQEIARLALFLNSNEAITQDFVAKMVGNWRIRKVWDMLDIALEGNVCETLRQLNLLLASGETPIGVFSQIAPTLRRFAAATELFLQEEQKGIRSNLRMILEKAGFKPFLLNKSEDQMKRLGRLRGSKILALLVKTDLCFKGDSRSNPRLILERFIVELAHPKMRNLG